MDSANISLEEFLKDRQGRTFADVAAGPAFGDVITFFDNPDRQRRMEEAEIHHDRAPLAGVVRELESVPSVNRFLGTVQAQQNQRLRQAIGVLIRMIMERRGWKKTGKKGSLGVRSSRKTEMPNHNNGGLAFWFLRAERYEHAKKAAYPSVRQRCRVLESGALQKGARNTAKGIIANENSSNGSTKRPAPKRRPKARD